MAFSPTLVDFFAPAILRTWKLRAELDSASPAAPAPAPRPVPGATRGATPPRPSAPRGADPGLQARVGEIFTDLGETVNTCKARAMNEGKRSEYDAEAARFAVVAWIDEQFGHLRATLGSLPLLQQQFYNHTNAGDIFFEKLKEFDRTRSEIAEVYLLMINLGFRGQLAKDSSGEQVARTRLDLARQLPEDMPELKALMPEAEPRDFVTPQPYKTPTPPPLKVSKPWWIWVVVAVLALLLLAALGLGAWWLLTRSEPEIDSRKVQAASAPLTCARVVSDIDPETRTVTVSGLVASQGDIDRLAEDLKAIEGVKAVDTADLEVVPRPFCWHERIVRDPKLVAPEHTDDIVFKRDRTDPTYYDGDNIYFSTEPEGEGHLNVWFLNPDGSIVHVLPWARRPETEVRAYQQLMFGAATPQDASQDNPPLTITPPLGQMLLGAVLTPEPLFPDGTYPGQAEAYFTKLEERLKDFGPDAIGIGDDYIMAEPTR